MRAFFYFALSGTVYLRFYQDFEFPSISTLTLLTSPSKRYDDVTFYSKLFLNLINQQKTCIFKWMNLMFHLCYHGNEVFGLAINNLSKLTNWIRSYMVV